MVKTVVLGLAILGALPVFAQQSSDHAVLPEQCRADSRLWYTQTKEDINRIPFDQLERRSQEMLNCLSVDSGDGEAVGVYEQDSKHYMTLLVAYTGHQRQRLLDFIKRRALTQVFLDEDKAGER